MNTVVLEQVMVLFLIMGVGFYAKKRGIIKGEVTKRLSDLLFQVTMPLLIISSFQFDFSKDMLKKVILVLLWAFLVHFGSVILGKLLYIKYPERRRQVLEFSTVFSNCGFMGFPVLNSIFGATAVFFGAVYLIPFNVFLWSYGAMVFSSEKKEGAVKKVLLNPGIIAVVIGMVMFLFSLKLPGPIYDAVDMVGSMTTPLSMLIVGALMADIKIDEILKGFYLYYVTAVRLILIPLITLLAMKLFNTPDDVVAIIVICAAMPIAANTAIFAEQYDGDAVLASKCIGISTLFSVITIPLIITILA